MKATSVCIWLATFSLEAQRLEAASIVDNDAVDAGVMQAADELSEDYFIINKSDQPCVDNDDTGIEVNGMPTTCADLEHDCRHATMGSIIRGKCPRTCYMCVPNGTNHTVHHLNDSHIVAYNGSSTCQDSTKTLVKYRNGAKATCQELIGYCARDDGIGLHVASVCPRSCGLCEVFMVPKEHWDSDTCWDAAPLAPPQFKIGGILATCPEIRRFCADNPNADKVRRKCPRTCGVCEPSKTTTATPEDDDADDDEDSSQPTTDTYVWTFPDETHGTTGQVTGCSRRRRWGFCYNRRRRAF